MLQDKDLRYICNLLHPVNVISLTREIISQSNFKTLSGPGEYDLILNVNETYLNIKFIVKDYIKYIKVRDNIKILDLEPALTLRALGVLGSVCDLELVQSAWREETIAIWSNTASAAMPGKVTIKGLDCTQQQLDLASIKAVSRFFRSNYHYNTAVLRGCYFVRDDNRVMVPIRYDKNNAISNYCIDASVMPLSTIKSKLFKVNKELIKVKRDHPYVFELHKELVKAWAKHGGLLYSPAAAFVSCVGQFGIQEGRSALATEFNGIPTSVTVCKLENNQVNICCNLDHRAWDGASAGEFYSFLEKEIQTILREEI